VSSNASDSFNLEAPYRVPFSHLATSHRGVTAFALTVRATHVPHRTDKPGTERTTTVTDMSPMTWSPSALAA
jgi:hypothetical protein